MSSTPQPATHPAPTPLDRLLEAVFGRWGAAPQVRAGLEARGALAAVGLLTVLGTGLRLWGLGTQSFWFDEADIVAQAQAPALHILTDFTKAGANGPLYTLLLHFWIGLVGTSEVAVRLLPVAWGVATIPLMYWAGRRIGGAALGLLGALLLTVSPFHIWHSQDAKMYTLVVFITLLSTTLYLNALEKHTAWAWTAYIAATWVALYAHILAGLILLAQLAVTPLLLRRARVGEAAPSPPQAKGRRNRLVIAWLVLILPFLPIGWDRIDALIQGNIDAGWLTPIGLGDMLGVLFVKFAVNRAPFPWLSQAEAAQTVPVLEWLGAAVMLALALLDGGLWLADWRRRRAQGTPPLAGDWMRAALLGLWALPIGLFWVTTLRVPLFEPRYMIIVLPFYLFMVAGGLLRWRALRPAWLVGALLLLVVPTVGALAGGNYGLHGEKENWRAAGDFVRQHERLRDVVIVYPGYLVTAVDYYRNADDLDTVPIRTIPQLTTANFGEREFNETLLAAITGHERAWLITSPPRAAREDPQGRVLGWFQANWHQFEKRVYNGVEVYGFSFNGNVKSWYPEPDHPQQVQYANGLLFKGYIYELRRNATTAQNASWLPLTLYWQAPTALPTSYAFRIELLDAAGVVRVNDGPLPPLNGYWPTTRWPPGAQIIDYRDVFLPGDLLPGPYTVRVTLDPPLPLADGSPALVFDTPILVRPWQK